MNDLKSFFATITGKVIGVLVFVGVGIFIGTHNWSSKTQPVEQPPTVAVAPVAPPLEVTPSAPAPIVSKPVQSTQKKKVVVNNPAPVTTTPPPAPAPITTTSAGILTVSGGTTMNDSIKQGTKGAFFTTFDFYPFSGESVVNSITVTRTGSSQDSDIGDIYLVDYPYGKKIFAGPQRLNSNHQVTFTGPWTFKHDGNGSTGFAIQADVEQNATTGDTYWYLGFNAFAFTDRRVLIHTGWLSTRSTSINYDKIIEVSVDEPFFSRIITKSGNLVIKTGGFGHDVILSNIESPYEVKKMLDRLSHRS